MLIFHVYHCFSFKLDFFQTVCKRLKVFHLDHKQLSIILKLLLKSHTTILNLFSTLYHNQYDTPFFKKKKKIYSTDLPCLTATRLLDILTDEFFMWQISLQIIVCLVNPWSENRMGEFDRVFQACIEKLPKCLYAVECKQFIYKYPKAGFTQK